MCFICCLIVLLSVSYVFAEPCQTSHGQNAVLTSLNDCPELFSAILNPRVDSEEYLKTFLHFKEDDLKVCCGNLSDYNKFEVADIKKIKFTITISTVLRGSKYKWLGSIQGNEIGKKEAMSLCLGALIDGRHFVTSADCVVHDKYVLTGIRFAINLDKDSNDEVEFEIEQTIIHPFYNIPLGLNNIAILRLKRTVLQTVGLQSALITEAENEYMGKNIDFFKWKNSLNDVDIVSAAALTEEHCKTNYNSKVQNCLSTNVNNSNLSGIISTGGPVVYTLNDEYYLEGILPKKSFHQNTSQPYLKIWSYINWIESNIKPYQDSCHVFDYGYDGFCSPLQHCNQLLHNITNPTKAFQKKMYILFCHFDSKDICCPYKYYDEVTPNLTIRNLDHYGKYSAQERFPWMVDVLSIFPKTNKEDLICLGNLINGRYVMTTAECFENSSNSQIYRVRLGMSTAEYNKKCLMEFFAHIDLCNSIVHVLVSEIIKHPYYEPERGFNNIALVQLIQSIQYTDNNKPIRLPIRMENINPNEMLHFVDINQDEKVFTITNEQCQKELQYNKLHNITKYELCTRDKNSEITCETSGSTLITYSKNNEWYIVGLGCRRNLSANEPIIHVNVANYLEWIQDNINQSPCVLPDGKDGEVVSLRACLKYSDAFAQPSPSAESYMQKFIYSRNLYRGIEVCCDISSNDTFEFKKISIQNLPVIPELNNLKRFCGYQHSDDYFHTTNETLIDEFPWLATLFRVNPNSDVRLLCGGSLINARYIITAAQCVSERALRHNNTLQVRLGEFHVKNQTDCVTVDATKACTDYKEYGIEEIIIHPFYDSSFYNGIHDIALIRLNKTVTYTEYIRPICLPIYKNTNIDLGDTLYTTGFGEDAQSGIKTEIKKKIISSLISNENCIEKLLKRGVKLSLIDKYEMCTLNATIKGQTCAGDGGGPLMSVYRAQWFLQGMPSRGATCRIGLPDIHTKISGYLDWIRVSMRPWTSWG